MNNYNQNGNEEDSLDDITPDEHEEQRKYKGQRAPAYKTRMGNNLDSDQDDYGQYSGGNKEGQKEKKNNQPIKSLKNQKIRIRCCEKWKEMCVARLGIFCSSIFCGAKCTCCTSIIRYLCCCCIRAGKIGPYTTLYEQASEKI